MLKLKLKNIFQIGTFAWAGFIFWFSLIKAPSPGAGDGTILHFTAYLLLAFLAIRAYVGKLKLWQLAAIAVCYGIALEILQNFAGRFMSLWDITANSLGALTAAIIIHYVGVLPRSDQSKIL